jgi:hypothetical protein
LTLAVLKGRIGEKKEVYLTCKRTKDELFLKDSDVEFIESLVKRLDLEDLFRVFDNMILKSFICSEVSILIDTHIEENKIFQQTVDVFLEEKVIPIVLDDNTKVGPGIQPLSLEMLAMLSCFTSFLTRARFGVIVKDDED